MTAPVVTFSAGEVCGMFDISPAKLDQLISDGVVGYFVAKRRKRFFLENVQQIRAAVEVTPKVDDDALARIGVTRGSRARRRSA